MTLIVLTGKRLQYVVSFFYSRDLYLQKYFISDAIKTIKDRLTQPFLCSSETNMTKTEYEDCFSFKKILIFLKKKKCLLSLRKQVLETRIFFFLVRCDYFAYLKQLLSNLNHLRGLFWLCIMIKCTKTQSEASPIFFCFNYIV